MHEPTGRDAVRCSNKRICYFNCEVKDWAWFSQSTLWGDITPEPEQEGMFSGLLSQIDPLNPSLRGALRPLGSKTACTCFSGSREKKKDRGNGHRRV